MLALQNSLVKQKVTLFSSLQYKAIRKNLIGVTRGEERKAMRLSLLKGRKDLLNYKFESEGKHGEDNNSHLKGCSGNCETNNREKKQKKQGGIKVKE